MTKDQDTFTPSTEKEATMVATETATEIETSETSPETETQAEPGGDPAAAATKKTKPTPTATKSGDAAVMALAAIKPESTATESAAIRERMRIYAEMSPAAKKLTDELRAINTRVSHGQMILRYEQAQKLLEADKPENSGTFGANFAERAGVCIGFTRNRAHGFKTVARQFTLDQIKKLAQQELADGTYINFTHLMTLTRIPTAADRQKMLKHAMSECLSSKALGDEVMSRWPDATRTNNGAGRPPTSPKSLGALVQDMENRFSMVTKRMTAAWDFSKLRDITETEVTEVLLKKAEEADQAWEALEEQLTQQHPKFVKSLVRIRKIAEAQEARRSKAEVANRKEEKNLTGKPAKRGRPRKK
jgi:hypothetical protein